MQLDNYVNKVTQWIKPYFTEKKPEVTTRRCCIGITNKNITLIHIDKADQNIKLLYADSMDYEDIKTLPLALSGIVQRYHLETTPTYLLLPPDDYQLFLVDSMPVKPDEMRDAIHWRIRSLINYPIEEAAIEYFMLPAKKAAKSIPMVATVVARMNSLANLVSLVKKSGFMLTTIDIPELAMRNLTSLYEDDEKSTAFIYFYENTAILNITCQKILYFTRRIVLSTTDDVATTDFEEFSLEILRYFDFFQSQWRYPTPSRVFITSANNNAPDLAEILSKKLLLSVEPYSLNAFSINEVKKKFIETNCLLTFGSSLRAEDKDVTPGN